MKTDFLAGGNFLRHMLSVEEVYSSTGTYFSVSPSLASGNEFFVHCKQYFFYFDFFSASENDYWNQFLKTNHFAASGHHFFSIFS